MNPPGHEMAWGSWVLIGSTIKIGGGLGYFDIMMAWERAAGASGDTFT